MTANSESDKLREQIVDTINAFIQSNDLSNAHDIDEEHLHSGLEVGGANPVVNQLLHLFTTHTAQKVAEAEYEGKRKMLRRMVMKGYLTDTLAINYLTIIEIERQKALHQQEKQSE